MTYFYYILVAFVAIGSLEGTVPDNSGTEFIVGFMENFGNTMNVELFVTTMEPKLVSVTISAPSFSPDVFKQITVTKGRVEQVLLDPALHVVGTTRDFKGIYIQSDHNVVVYGTNKATYSNDAFLGLPVSVLGQEYYIMTHSPVLRQAQMLIIGVTSGTSVDIKLPRGMTGNVFWNSMWFFAGNIIRETIERFETLQITHRGDLTGTKITSSKPVAVFSGNQKTNIGAGTSSDHIVEMWYPVERWGKEFLTVPIPDRTVGDKFRFVASRDNTDVKISGDCSESFVLQSAGDMKEVDISSDKHCHVVANEPILVAQFVLSQQDPDEMSDPSMMIVPATNQYSSAYTFSTPTSQFGSYKNYLMIVIKERDKDGLYLDDVNISSTFHTIPGTDYVGGYINVDDGAHTVKHTSPVVFFGGYLYGWARYETYAFPIGMRLALINIICLDTMSWMTVGDGKDNDCDEFIDEEICRPQGIDDDFDGKIDEDCVDLDECIPDPCMNSGTCVDEIGSYSCLCTAGYTDVNCSTDINECESNPCVHSGTCKHGIDSFTCLCPSGFTGIFCDINIDECISSPCRNNGSCVDGANGYVCICDDGYGGKDCWDRMVGCASNPCLNGGDCMDGQGSYSCICKDGFSGTFCEHKNGKSDWIAILAAILVIAFLASVALGMFLIFRQKLRKKTEPGVLISPPPLSFLVPADDRIWSYKTKRRIPPSTSKPSHP